MKYFIFGAIIFALEISLLSDVVPFVPVLGDSYDLLNFGISTVLYTYLGYGAFFNEKKKIIGLVLFLLALVSGALATILLMLMRSFG